jgi:CubicO group peptidase (beta-lactamase class C family)
LHRQILFLQQDFCEALMTTWPQVVRAVALMVAVIPIWSCRMDKSARVDKLFEPYQGENTPGAAVLIIKHGQPILAKAFGCARLDERIPVTPPTNFRLASVTKQFTAMCIMMLVERGELTYEMTLQGIFPDFPDYGREITVRHLLTHTSGLIDYEDLIPDTAIVQVLDKDVLTMMKQQDSTYFVPGAQHRYSNTGYALLAMIVEKVAQKSFAQFLKENIFDRLGMANTIAYENGISTVTNRAMGYREEEGEFIFKDQSLTSAVLGDGGIYSSVEDLYKWDQALYTDRLVKIETLQQALTPAALNDGTVTDYGFGWRLDEYRGHRRMHRTGSTSGFQNIIQRYPDDKFTVIILTNRAEPEVAPLADRLTDLFLIE